MGKISISAKVAPKDMILEQVSSEISEEFKKVYEENKPYKKYTWALTRVLTLEQFKETVDPKYKDISCAYVIAKQRKDNGKIFHKIEVMFNNSDSDEWELSYDRSRSGCFEEGDELDVNTLMFCIEVHDDTKHLFATGDLL